MRIIIQNGNAVIPKLTATQNVVGGGDSIDPEMVQTVEYSSTEASEFQYVINSTLVGTLEGMTVESLTPSICDTTNFPIVVQLSNGIGRIKVANNQGARILSLDFRNTETIAKNVTGFEEGSWIKYAWDILKPMMDSSTDANVFTSGHSTIPSGVYNTNCWGYSFDLTGVPIGSSWPNSNPQWSTVRGGALITNQHLASCYHWQHDVGDRIRFAARDGTIVERTIIGKSGDWQPELNPDWYAVANNAGVYDRIVYTLNSPVSESIKVYPIAIHQHGSFGYFQSEDPPQEFGDYSLQGQVPANSYKCKDRIIGIWMNQFRQLRIGLWLGESDLRQTEIKAGQNLYGETLPAFYLDRRFSTDWTPNCFGMMEPYVNQFMTRAIVGDSGSACFVPLNNTDLALVTNLLTPGSGSSLNEGIMNILINAADDDAISRNNLEERTGKTVTMADDPTLE